MGVLALAFIFLMAAPAQPGGSPPAAKKTSMPLTLSGDAGFPLWVDSRAALTQSGQFNEALFHPGPALRVKQLLETEPVDGCVLAPEISVNRTNAQPRETLDDAIKNSEFVLLGRVTGRSFGFYAGEAGQLLRIAPERVLRGEAGRVDAYYAFMPVGDFKVGATKICKTNTTYAPPPEIGEEVVTFTFAPSGSFVQVDDPGDIVVVNRAGELLLPRKYSRGPERTLSATPQLNRFRID